MKTIPPNSRPLTGAPPKLKAPPGTVDSHVHVYLEGFAPHPDGPGIVELATVEDYRAFQSWLGLDRVVLTQSNAYQFDNGATLMALEALGTDKARAIITLEPDTGRAELERLHALGVRGIRIMNFPGGATKIADMAPVERLAREIGWSLIVQFNGCELEEHLPALEAIEVDYVIDHVGKFIPPVPADDRRVDEILRLVDRGNAWFKIAACYETSLAGAPDYADVAPIAKRVIAHAPERIVWSTNWPHVGVPRERYPHDPDLLDVLLDWATAEQRQKILVDNPTRLYGFDPR